MSRPKNMYAKLDDSESTPLFQVTRGKNCRLYPYLWTKECAEVYGNGDAKSNPYRCSAKGPVDPNQNYTGFNVSFAYDMAGTKCKDGIQEYPNVL